jgi:hypothetical protein
MMKPNDPMKVYRPNDDEAAAAFLVAKRRNTLNNGASNLPNGEQVDAATREWQHYAACLAEIAVARVLNRCWSGCGKGTLERHDVGNCYEVRSITDRSRGLLVRAKDDGNTIFILVFVDVETRNCEILGWEIGQRIRQKGRMLDPTSPKPCWVLPAADLIPIQVLMA